MAKDMTFATMVCSLRDIADNAEVLELLPHYPNAEKALQHIREARAQLNMLNSIFLEEAERS